MRLRRRLVTLALALLVIAAFASGAFVGTSVGRAASAPVIRQVSIAAPGAFAGPAAAARRSPGGFTGFGGSPALAGNVLRGGTVETSDRGTLAISSGASTITLRPTSNERFYSIAATNSGLRPGESVQVFVRDGAVTSVLKLPPGLGEGGNR